jgi:hypothetical protein
MATKEKSTRYEWLEPTSYYFARICRRIEEPWKLAAMVIQANNMATTITPSFEHTLLKEHCTCDHNGAAYQLKIVKLQSCRVHSLAPLACETPGSTTS